MVYEVCLDLFVSFRRFRRGVRVEDVETDGGFLCGDSGQVAEENVGGESRVYGLGMGDMV